MHHAVSFMLDLKKEQKADYIQKITAMASAIGYTVCALNMRYVMIYTYDNNCLQDHHCSQGTANHLVFTHTTSS